MRLSISELTTYRWSLDQDIREYSNSDHNISAVGIWRQKLDDYESSHSESSHSESSQSESSHSESSDSESSDSESSDSESSDSESSDSEPNDNRPIDSGPSESRFGNRTDAAIELVRRSGIAVSSLTWAGGFTGGDVRTYREAIDDGIEAIHVAAALGAECLIVYTGPRAGHTKKHARRLASDALSELANVADDFDVIIAVEPTRACCADMWTFLNDIDSAVQFIDEVRGGEVKLVYDTYHLAHTDFSPQHIAEIADRTALVQLSDSKIHCRECLRKNEPSRRRLGRGKIPIADIVSAFESNGYSGYYEVEIFGPAVEQYDYHQSLSDIRAFYDGLGVINSKQTRRSLPRT